MYSETDGSLPFGLDNPIPEYHNFSVASKYNPIFIEMEVAWIQDLVKKQYRQMCNELSTSI